MADFFDKLARGSAPAGRPSAGKRRARARSLWFAGALMAIGLAIAVSEKSKAPKADSADVENATPAAESAATGSPSRTPALPATFRLGAGYAGGFFIGWLFRKFLKTALLVSGGLLGLVALARKLGWFDLDWNVVESYVRGSLAWISGRAGTFKDFLTGYLPSAGAAALGLFFGLRSK